MAKITDELRYANGNEKADALIDPALRTSTAVYPDEDIMGRLFALQAMPENINRLRAQIWNEVKEGRP
jgi:putrescine transport system substrate-binding protein